MTNREILSIALEQSAVDCGCRAEDFLQPENRIVTSGKNENARRYLALPFSCQLVSYGSNVVASVDKRLYSEVERFINSRPVQNCFESPSMYILNRILEPYQQRVCFMAEYFLPDVEQLRELPCGYSLKVMGPKDFAGCYLPQWSNALCEKRKHLDVLAVGAFDKGELIGLAGCSADCDTMWQIGVDVLPGYRRQGIAAALTSRLAMEILQRGKAPFYCAAWSNVKSVRNALKSGFKPAWVELTAKSLDFIDEMNRAPEEHT